MPSGTCADSDFMAFWLMVGGAILGAWAVLRVIGDELVRRTRQVEAKLKAEELVHELD